MSPISFDHDTPHPDDALGRRHFAESLARSLPLPPDSPGLVVGIEGSWGSGKSTLIQWIAYELSLPEPDRAPVVVNFNPWMISATGALVESLIAQIAVAIGADASKAEKGIAAGEKLLNYIGVFNKLKYLKYVPDTGFVGNIAEAAEAFFSNSEHAVEQARRAIEDTRKLLPSIDLTSKRQAVTEALRAFDKPIVVIIDDIDRLLPAEIGSMMQSIKAVADFPRTTYLLAYDRAVVAAALGSSATSGSDYLDKIVQVAYPIPPLFARQRRVLVEQKIARFLKGHNITQRPFEQEVWNEAMALLARLLPTPRDSVRLVNRLMLSIPASHKEVNIVDTIVFEAVSMRYPQVRQAVCAHPDDFAGSFQDDDATEAAPRYRQRDQPAPPPRTELSWKRHVGDADAALIAACEFLFPLQPVRERNGIDLLRIANPERLARLLRMTSIDGIPETSQIHEMLQQPDRLASALAACMPDEAVHLLPWISSYAGTCQNPDIKGSARALIAYAVGLAPAQASDTALTAALGDTLNALMRSADANSDELLLTVVNDAPLAIARAAIDGALDRNGGARALPAPVRTQAIELFSARVRQWIDAGAPGSTALVHAVFDAYHRCGNPIDAIRSAIATLWQSDPWLETFVAGFTTRQETALCLRFVGDYQALAARIEACAPLADHYQWVIDGLRSEVWRREQEIVDTVMQRVF